MPLELGGRNEDPGVDSGEPELGVLQQALQHDRGVGARLTAGDAGVVDDEHSVPELRGDRVDIGHERGAGVAERVEEDDARAKAMNRGRKLALVRVENAVAERVLEDNLRLVVEACPRENGAGPRAAALEE